MKTFEELKKSFVVESTDPRPFRVVKTVDRFGKPRSDVYDYRTWQTSIVHQTKDHNEAKAHAEALNKAHREKHGIPHP